MQKNEKETENMEQEQQIRKIYLPYALKGVHICRNKVEISSWFPGVQLRVCSYQA